MGTWGPLLLLLAMVNLEGGEGLGFCTLEGRGFGEEGFKETRMIGAFGARARAVGDGVGRKQEDHIHSIATSLLTPVRGKRDFFLLRKICGLLCILQRREISPASPTSKCGVISTLRYASTVIWVS